MNTIVSFELAKLVSCSGYSKDKYNHEHNEREWDMFGERIKEIYFPFPTIAEVVMWIYEKHGIWISVDMVFEEQLIGFWYCIRESKDTDHAVTSDEYNSPTKAYEVAIQYCLNNLINE